MADIIVNPPQQSEQRKSPLSPQMPTAPTKEALEMKFELDPTAFEGNSGTVITTDKGIEIKENTTNRQDKKGPGQDVSTLKAPNERKETQEPAKLVESGAKRSDQNDSGRAQQGERTEGERVPASENKEPKSVLKAPEDTSTPVKKEDNTPAIKETPQQETSHKIDPIAPPERKDAFDYSKYTPQEVINLKNMSRQSREFAVKLMEENKQLQAKKDSLYLQHEQGYLLSPEYKEMSETQNKLLVEGNAWKSALMNIKQAKPYKEPIGYGANGELLYSPEKAPTDEDELRISQIFSNTSNQYSNVSQKLNTLPRDFNNRVNADLIVIKDIQKQLFAWETDQNLLNHSVEVDGQGDRTLNEIKQEFLSQVPSYMRSHPMSQAAANMMIALRIRTAELKEARASAQVATIKQKEVARGEPSSNDNPAAQTSGSKRGVPSVFSLENFPS